MKDHRAILVLVIGAIPSPRYFTGFKTCRHRNIPDHRGIQRFRVNVYKKGVRGVAGSADGGIDRVLPSRRHRKLENSPAAIRQFRGRGLLDGTFAQKERWADR